MNASNSRTRLYSEQLAAYTLRQFSAAQVLLKQQDLPPAKMPKTPLPHESPARKASNSSTDYLPLLPTFADDFDQSAMQGDGRVVL